MAIELKASGFREWHDHYYGIPSMGVESNRIEECVAHYHSQNFRGMFGNPSFAFNQDNLDFLALTTNARFIWFWDILLKNVDALYELTELDYFGVHPKRPGIDFSRLPGLRTVVNQWIKADTGISQSTITEYHLWHFKPTSKSFAGVEIPAGVQTLHLYWANPATLEGLPVMEQLTELQIHRCRNLHDLSTLPHIAPKLEQLRTTTSSKIQATSGVLDHPQLKTVLIDGKFLVGDGR